MNPVSTCLPARLSCDVPPGWYVKESLTLLAPDGSANVLMSSEPLDDSTGSAEYAAEQGRLLQLDFPGYHEFECRPVPWPHDYPAWFRRFQWCPPDGPEVEQFQVYWVDRGRGYTGTATSPVAMDGRADRTLRSILRTFRATDNSGETASAPGGPGPLGPWTPTATLGLLDWNFEEIDEGAVLAMFSLDPTVTGRSALAVIVQVPDPATYLVTAQLTQQHPRMERWWQVVAIANDWNSGWRWPTASVQQRADAPDEAEVVLRHHVYLPGGATIDQLADLTDRTVVGACDFWAWAHREHGL